MADLGIEVGVGAEEFVNSAGGAGEFGVVVVVNDDNSPLGEARQDELETSFDRAIEVTVAKGKGDLSGKVLRFELVEPGFFDDDVS